MTNIIEKANYYTDLNFETWWDYFGLQNDRETIKQAYLSGVECAILRTMQHVKQHGNEKLMDFLSDELVSVNLGDYLEKRSRSCFGMKKWDNIGWVVHCGWILMIIPK